MKPQIVEANEKRYLLAKIIHQSIKIQLIVIHGS